LIVEVINMKYDVGGDRIKSIRRIFNQNGSCEGVGCEKCCLAKTVSCNFSKEAKRIITKYILREYGRRFSEFDTEDWEED